MTTTPPSMHELVADSMIVAERTEYTLIVAEKSLYCNQSTIQITDCIGTTMSVAQATVTQTVSHVPVRPKYGRSEPNPNMALDASSVDFFKEIV